MPVDLLETERLIDRGQTGVAVTMLEDAVGEDPGYAAAWFVLARAYEGEGRLEDAVSAWRSVRTLVPDSPTGAVGLKRALRLRLLRASDASVAAMLPLFHPDEPDLAPPVESGPEESAPEAQAAPAPVESEPEPAESEPEDAALEGADTTAPENLDDLIQELETARIVPDPTIEPATADDLDTDVEDVVSETLARIYANQRHYDEAARVYETLAGQQPDRAAEFRQKAAALRSQAG